MSPALIWPYQVHGPDITSYKNRLKNLSKLPQPITQAWQLTIPIPGWILAFFHIKRGLLITLEITISAHWEAEEENSFTIEIFFRRVIEGTLIPQSIEELRIVFGYLWPNPYYQTADKETARAPSRVSLVTGVTMPWDTTMEPSPSPEEELQEVPLPPPILPELPELPGIADYNWRVVALWQRVKSHNQWVRELPLTVNQRLDSLLTHIWLGINLNEIAFSDGNITFRQLRNIDCNENPQFYSELSQHEDDNYEPSHLEELDSQNEKEGEEESPLPIPDPTGINSLTPSSVQDLSKWFSNNMRESLERHLGTIIEETFWERSQTPE